MMSNFPPKSQYFFAMAFLVGIQTANAMITPSTFATIGALFLWFLFLKIMFETAWRV